MASFRDHPGGASTAQQKRAAAESTGVQGQDGHSKHFSYCRSLVCRSHRTVTREGRMTSTTRFTTATPAVVHQRLGATPRWAEAEPCPPKLVFYGFLSARRGCVLVGGVCPGGVVGGQVGVAGHGDRAVRVLR